MSTKMIKGNMLISRDNRNKISIQVQCQSSLAGFLEIELTTDQFAMLVTGCHQSDIPMTVRGLDVVGKTRVLEKRQVLCPLKTYAKDELSKWLTLNCQEDGWKINAYLGSQSSTKHVDNGVLLNYSICKWVDEEDSK